MTELTEAEREVLGGIVEAAKENRRGSGAYRLLCRTESNYETVDSLESKGLVSLNPRDAGSPSQQAFITQAGFDALIAATVAKQFKTLDLFDCHDGYMPAGIAQVLIAIVRDQARRIAEQEAKG